MDDTVLSDAEVRISKVVSVERDQDGIRKVELESLVPELELDVREAVAPDAEVQDLPPLGRNALFETPTRECSTSSAQQPKVKESPKKPTRRRASVFSLETSRQRMPWRFVRMRTW